MNIVHLSNSIAPRWQAGGPVRLFFDYINEISRDENIRVSVIGGVDEIGLSPYYPQVEYFPFQLKELRLGSIKFYHVSWFKLFRTIIKSDPEIIVLNELRGQNVIVSLLYKLIFNRKVELRNVPCGHILNTEKLTYKIHDMLVVILGGLHVTYFAQNQVEFKSLKARFATCRILPLSIKTIEAVPKDSLPKLQGIRLISVGRNSVLKGFGDALELIKGIDFKISYSVMSIPQGDHDFSQMDLNYIEPDFTDNRFEAYKQFDIAILLPRICEQTSLGLVEFLSVGIPVIYNINSDMPYVDGVCGVRIPSNTRNPQDLQSAIEKIQENYLEYSKNAVKVVLEYYNVERNARTLFSKN